MHSVGTLPLHMYQKDIPLREAIQFKDLESEVAGEPQESQYDLLIPLTVSFNGNLAKSVVFFFCKLSNFHSILFFV